ncbi:MAG: acyl-CoA dehydrogenase family protein [Desulfobacterales bacterium]
MDFKFDEKSEALRKEVREFVKENIPKDIMVGMFVDEHFDEDWEFSMKMSKKLSENGWLTMSWPKEYSGRGASVWERCVMGEETGYWGIPGMGMGVSGTSWVGPSLMLFGTEEQKKKYIPMIASGEADGIWCTGYSEPDSGSDLASLQTEAKRVGDEYIINGQKVWTSVGHRARYCWLACRTDPNAKRKHDGISLIMVDMKSPGVTVRPIPNIVGAKIFTEIFFKDVRVPVENLVGKENNGWAQLMQALAFERSFSLGSSSFLRRIFDELVVCARQTGAIKKPGIRSKLTDLAIEIRALRNLALEAAWKVSKGEMVIYEPSRDKSLNDEIMEKIGTVGTEVIGSYAQVDPLDRNTKHKRLRGIMEWAYWLTPGGKFAAGTTDTNRNIVAQFALGLPRGY